MRLAVCAISMIISFGFVAEAEAGPAWCASVGTNRIDGDSVSNALEVDSPRNAISAIVSATCKPTDEAKQRAKEIEAARQKWTKRLDMIEADWADAATWALLDQGSKMSGSVRLNTNGKDAGIGHTLKRTWSGFDAIDQYASISTDVGVSGDMSLDKNYFVDAIGSRLTETGRVAYVAMCIRSKLPVQWAMCQPDIALLDFKKVAAEIRASKAYQGEDKMRLRLDIDDLKPRLAAHADTVKKLMAQDPGYAKLFEVATATRKEWDARAKTDAALLESALAMDDARATNSRKAFDGCEAKAWTAWRAAMATVPASKFTGMQDDRENAKSFIDVAMGPIVSNPQVYLASVALTTCHAGTKAEDDKTDILLRALGDAMSRWPGFRGPRTATQSAILTTGITLDDRDATIEHPDVNRSGFGGGGGSRSGSGSGVVAKVKPSGKTVVVEFKKQLVKQVQCAQVKYSNRVTQIRSNGELVYEGTCIKNETVTIDRSSSPQTVNPRYSEGVKPGMMVSVIEDVIVAAWAKPGAATPSMVFGIALK